MASIDRRTRERNAVREKILSAARDLFVAQGFEAVTMRAIAETIEYTPAALYTHFASKDDLIFALCDEDFTMLRRAFGEMAQGITDPVDRLRELGRGYVRFALSHPHHFRLMFMTSHPPMTPAEIEHFSEAVKDRKGDPDEDAYAFLSQTVAECIRAGRFKERYSDEATVTQMCWAAAHGVVALYLTHEHDPWLKWQPPAETAYALLDAMLDGMLRPREGTTL